MRKRTFVRTTRLVAIAVAGLVVSSTTASAVVLIAKSEAQKLRADIQKQQHGLVVVPRQGGDHLREVRPPRGQRVQPRNRDGQRDADAKGKFAGDIAKCESKLNFLKKAKTLDNNSAYTAFGCPGDSDDGTAGDQPYADVAGWQAATAPATRTQINTLAVALGALSGCGDPMDDVKTQQKCQNAEVKRISSYAAAIQKCQLACENDFSNKKGNGGTSDSIGACSLNAGATAGTGDANFNACIGKAYAKATKTPIPANVTLLVMPALSTALTDANNDVNNENDCP